MTEDFDHLRASLSERYYLERELGRGGMATVYLARDLKHDRQVVIKVMKPEVATSLGGERFLGHTEVAGQLQHPNILMLLDSGEVDDVLYYVMPYVEGETLADRLGREDQLPIEDALQVIREVASALDYAHRQSIVHRNITPDNILLTGGHAVIKDFGIGTMFEVVPEDEAGITVGPPTYLSPEQMSGQGKIDGRSDIYALGVVLYEMLVGEPPYTGPTAQAIVAKQVSDPIPSTRRIRETIPLEVDAAIEKSLAKEPADRFATAEDFAAALSPGSVSTGSAAPSKATSARRFAVPVGIAGVVILLVAFLGWRFLVTGGTPDSITLAVLPFENVGQPDDAYFADGMTDEVADRLSRVSGLSVTARTSAARFAGSELSAGEIGDELKVEYLLSGTVRWAKADDGTSRVRLTPRLVRVSDESQVWSDSYDGDFRGVFELQADLAEQVAQAMNVTLLASEEVAIRTAPTTSEAAWGQYSFGRHYYARSDGARAAEHFEAAIELDPDFALAYAGLADAYHHTIGRASQGGRLAEKMDGWARAEQAARRALALDSTLGPAYVSLGYVQMMRDLDWERAEANILRGLALDPDYAQGRSRHQWLLQATGRTDSAVAEARRAVELDPLSPLYASNLANALFYAGRFEEVPEAAARSLALDSTFLVAYVLWGTAEIFMDNWPAAAEMFKLAGLPPGFVDPLVAAMFDRRRVPEFLASLDNERGRAMVLGLPLYMAVAFTLVGEHERAISTIERGVEDRAFDAVTGVKTHPLLDPLRSEPRFQALLDSMGLQ